MTFATEVLKYLRLKELFNITQMSKQMGHRVSFIFMTRIEFSLWDIKA